MLNKKILHSDYSAQDPHTQVFIHVLVFQEQHFELNLKTELHFQFSTLSPNFASHIPTYEWMTNLLKSSWKRIHPKLWWLTQLDRHKHALIWCLDESAHRGPDCGRRSTDRKLTAFLLPASVQTWHTENQRLCQPNDIWRAFTIANPKESCKCEADAELPRT